MGPRACGSNSLPARISLAKTKNVSRHSSSAQDGSTMSNMLTLTVQLALATAVLPATPSASAAASPPPAHVRVVAQGWRGEPRTAPPPPPPPAPVVAQPRTMTAYPTQAPPPPVVERFGPRRGWLWIGGHYDWNRGRY